MKTGKQHPPIYETGVIHGRFQVLHNDHVKYIMAGKTLCRHLVIGITNPEPLPTVREETNPDRNLPLSNPLTYYERYLMLKAVMLAAVPPECFSIVPFPIHIPEAYQYYVPTDAVFFVSIYDDWGRKKKERFQNAELITHVLWEVPPEKKGISGSDVRKRMAAEGAWAHLVPPEVCKLLKKWNIADRLRRLQASLQ